MDISCLHQNYERLEQQSILPPIILVSKCSMNDASYTDICRTLETSTAAASEQMAYRALLHITLFDSPHMICPCNICGLISHVVNGKLKLVSSAADREGPHRACPSAPAF